MSRQPLKKLNDNFELKGEIVNGNRTKEEIVSEQPEANRKLTKTNNIIYATVKTIQDKLLSPPKAGPNIKNRTLTSYHGKKYNPYSRKRYNQNKVAKW